jgi:hypothetical protein
MGVVGLESRQESRLKGEVRLDFEVPAGWMSPSSHGLWGGDALHRKHAAWKPKPKP